MNTYEQVRTVLEELWAEELDREDDAQREAEEVVEGERRWVRERREAIAAGEVEFSHRRAELAEPSFGRVVFREVWERL